MLQGTDHYSIPFNAPMFPLAGDYLEKLHLGAYAPHGDLLSWE